MTMLRQLQHQMLDTSSGRASSTYSDPSISASGTPCPLWLLDSSASLHMTPDASLLTSCRPLTHITRVRIADGTPLPISSISHLSTLHSLYPQCHMFPVSL